MVKGQAGFELLIMGVMVVFAIFIVGLMPTTSVKSKLDQETIFEYKYNKVQHTLLTLFSITHNQKKVSEFIAEKNSIDKSANLDFLKPILEKQIDSKCYQLNVSDQILLSADDCNPKYRVNSTIVFPYNPNKLVGEIEVGIE